MYFSSSPSPVLSLPHHCCCCVDSSGAASTGFRSGGSWCCSGPWPPGSPSPSPSLPPASRSPLSEAHLHHLLPLSSLPLPHTTMKVRVVCRKIYDYVRIDLKEIAFPSSLPDPPGFKPRPKLTWKDKLYVLKEASSLYAAIWVRDIGPDLRPSDYNKEDDYAKGSGDKEPSVVEDLAVAAYRDALKSFIVGYQEGIQQVAEEKRDFKSQEQTGGGSNPS